MRLQAGGRNRLPPATSGRCRGAIYIKSLVVCLVIELTARSSLAAVKVFNDQHKPSHPIEHFASQKLPIQSTTAVYRGATMKPIKSAIGRSIKSDVPALNQTNAIARSPVSQLGRTDGRARPTSENKTKNRHWSLKFAYDISMTAKQARQRENNRRLLIGERPSSTSTTTTTTTRTPSETSQSKLFDEDDEGRANESDDVELGVGSFTLARIGDLAQNSTDVNQLKTMEAAPITGRKLDEAVTPDLPANRNQVVGTQRHTVTMNFNELEMAASSVSNRSHLLSASTGRAKSPKVGQASSTKALLPPSLYAAQSSVEPTLHSERAFLASSGPRAKEESNEIDDFVRDEPSTLAHHRPPLDSLGAPVTLEEGSESDRRLSVTKPADAGSTSTSRLAASAEDFLVVRTSEGENGRSVHRRKQSQAKGEALRPILMTSGVKVHSGLMLVQNGNRSPAGALPSPVLLASSAALPFKNSTGSNWGNDRESSSDEKRQLLMMAPGSQTGGLDDVAAAMKATTMRRLPANEGGQNPDYFLEIDQDEPGQEPMGSPQRYYQGSPDQEALLGENQLGELPDKSEQGGLFAGFKTPLAIDRAKSGLTEVGQSNSQAGYEYPTRREEVNEAGSWLGNSYLRKKLSQLKTTAASSGIRVSAGERSTPLVINSRGLIMAAKLNGSSSARPFNASMLSNQVDSSLSPIGKAPHLQGAVTVFDDGDHHTIVSNRGDLNRPTFLKKPINLSATIWRHNSSSPFDGQPSKMSELEVYNQAAGELAPFASKYNTTQFADYGGHYSEQPFQRGRPHHQHHQHHNDRAPAYEVVPEDIFDEPMAGSHADAQLSKRFERHKYQQQQQQAAQEQQSLGGDTSANGSSPFYHNPPYKQQLASVELAQQTNNTSSTTGRTSVNQTSSSNQSTTRKPTAKPSQVSQNGKLQPYVGFTEVERIYMQSGSQQSERVGLAASASSAIYSTTTPPYDTTLAAELNSSSLSPPVNPAYAHNNSSKTGNKIRNKLQHMIISRIVKNQLGLQQQQAAQQAAAAASAGTSSLAAAPTPPPLLSSTVANNVASLLAQKLNFLVRPLSSGSSPAGAGSSQHSGYGLNSLFGIRLGGAGNGVNKFKHRINPFLNPMNSHIINRRTTNIGSILFSGFIYGLSVLPALMALTGINPMNIDTGQASANSPPTTVANRHGKNERKLKPTGYPLPVHHLGADQAALASSYAYLVPLMSAAANSLETNPDDTELSVDSIPSSVPTHEAQQSAIKALYAAPPTIIGPAPSSLSSLSSEYHPLLDGLSSLGNVEAAGSSQPSVISLSQLTANDLLSSLMSGNYKSNNLHSSLPGNSGLDNLWQPERSGGGGGSAGRQVRDIGAYELRGGQLNLSEVRRPFGDEFAFDQLAYDDRTKRDAGKGAVSQSASSNHVRHGYSFDRDQPPLVVPLVIQSHNVVQPNPESGANGQQAAQHWPRHGSNQPFNNINSMSAQSSFGDPSATPSRFVPATSMGNQQSATSGGQLHFTPQSDTSMRSQRQRNPQQQQPEYESSGNKQAFMFQQRQPSFPTVRPPTASSTSKSSPANAVDTDELIIRDPFSAPIGDNSLLDSLENFMSNRRRRTPSLPKTTTESSPTDAASTSKPPRGGANRLATKSRRITAGGSRLIPTFASDNQPWQPNASPDKFQVGYTLNYSPAAAAKHTSLISSPADDREWRAIVPPKTKSPAKWPSQRAGGEKHLANKAARKTGSPKSKASDLLSGNSQHVYTLLNRNANKWPLTVANTVKQAKPRRKKPPSDGHLEKVSPLFGNDTESELLMAHSMALGNGVLNEPASITPGPASW